MQAMQILQEQIDCREKNANRFSMRLYLAVKYGFDIIITILLGLMLLLPMLLVALVIRLDSKGPVLFTQPRIGQYGKVFKLYKFRTMRTDAPPNMPTAQFTTSHEYITRVGQFLRKTSIDELPQLLNVLKGDMSFVGFRPLCTTEHELNTLRAENGVYCCRPGITGLAQVRGRDNLSSKEKLKYEIIYKNNRSISLDVYCLAKTIPVVLSQRGVK